MKKGVFIFGLCILICFLIFPSVFGNLENVSSEVTITGVAAPQGGGHTSPEKYFYAVLTMPTIWNNETTLTLRTYVGNFIMEDPDQVNIKICLDINPKITHLNLGEHTFFYNFSGMNLDSQSCWIELRVTYQNEDIFLKRTFTFSLGKNVSEEENKIIMVPAINGSVLALKQPTNVEKVYSELERAILYTQINEVCSNISFGTTCVLGNQDIVKLKEALKGKNISIETDELILWISQYNARAIENVIIPEKDIVSSNLTLGTVFYVFKPKKKLALQQVLYTLVVIIAVLLVLYLLIKKHFLSKRRILIIHKHVGKDEEKKQRMNELVKHGLLRLKKGKKLSKSKKN